MSLSHATSPQTVHAAERTLTKTVGYKYLLALPEGYHTDATRRWPVLLFLHGSGERGDDPWSAAKHGPPKLLRGEGLTAREQRAAQKLHQDFIVVSPLCPRNTWWDPEGVLVVLDEVMRASRVDRDRVYLTGMSMGGYGAWALGTAHPDRFAAIAPVCGGGEFAAAFMSSNHKRDALLSLGVWAFHGIKDPLVPVAESQRMTAMLQHMGVKHVDLTLYPEAQHDSWTETYANPALYDWFLRHHRSTSPDET
jgi:predicted peptidase